MSRIPQTKPDPNPTTQQRKFISPNKLRSNDKPPQNNPKTQQYRSPEGKSIPNPIDKNKSQHSSEAHSRSSTQKEKVGTQRSRSKERKDYMTTNLARLTRKKQEKLSSSNVSEKSQQSHTQKTQIQKQRYIYTFKQEVKPVKNDQISQEYAKMGMPMPSSIEKIDHSVSSASQISPLLPSSIGERKERNGYEQKGSNLLEKGNGNAKFDNNGSGVVNFKGRQLQVNVVRYEQRTKGISELQIKENQLKKPQSNNGPVNTQTKALSFKRLPSPEPSVIPKEQPHLPSLASNSPQLTLLIRRLQSEKQSFQDSLTKLLQQNFKLQGQNTFLSNKCEQVQRELSLTQDAVSRGGREAQRTGTANQRMFLELEERYNALLQEYRTKNKQGTEMGMALANAERRVEELSNSLRTVEEQLKIKTMQNDKNKRVFEAKLLQARQEFEFQAKNLELRYSGQLKKDPHLQQALQQLQRQLSTKNREISLKDEHISQLEFQLREKEQLQALLSVKQTEKTQLLSQLNRNKQILYRNDSQKGTITQKMSFQLKEKDRTICDLTEQLQAIKKTTQRQKLSLDAKTDLFSNSHTETSSFQDLIKSQTDQTNKLRTLLSEREDQVHHLNQECIELKERLRRVEQELQLNARTYAVNMNNVTQVQQATEMMLKRRIVTLEALTQVK